MNHIMTSLSFLFFFHLIYFRNTWLNFCFDLHFLCSAVCNIDHLYTRNNNKDIIQKVFY